MADRDVFPADKADRAPFRYGFSHKDEIAIRREIEELKKKSQEQMKAVKAEKKREKLKVEEDDTMAKLTPQFGKERMPYKRKTHPIFHELSFDLEKKKKELETAPTMSSYNALDKSNLQQASSKTKKLPFSKAEYITPEAMRVPRVSSLGVLPTRSTAGVKGLNVVMTGATVISKDDGTITAISEANVAKKPEDDSTKSKTSEGEIKKDDIPATTTPASTSTMKTKPAIVGTIGTLAPVTFSTRAKPPLRPRSEKIETVPTPPPPKSRASSRASSKATKKKFKATASARSQLVKARVSSSRRKRRSSGSDSSSEESSDDEENRKRSLSRVGFRERSARSAGSGRSVSSNKSAAELLAEAQAIASGETGAAAGKDQENAKEEGEPVPPVPSERSVDDIISSLKASREGKREMSAADIKIQEIMQRVMVRAKAVLGHDVEEEEMQDEEDEGIGDEDGEQVPGLPDISVALEPSGEGEATDDQEATADGTPGDLTLDATARESGEIGDSVTPGFEERADGEKAGEDVAAKPSQVEFAEAIEHIPDEGTVLDLDQAWQDILMPQDVSYEDIVHVEGEPHPIEERKEVSKTDVIIGSRIPVFSSSVSFLSTWAPKEKKTYETVKEEPSGLVRTRSIHHFCTHAPELPLPGHLQAVTRTFHAPAKYGLQQKTAEQISLGRESNQSYHSQLSESQSILQKQMMEREDRERRMSAAARRILELASDDSLDVWQQRAEEVFGEEDAGVDGQKMPIRTDISRLYWTPAPPKMDVPPAYVQSHLFPSYHGAALAQESEKATTIGEESGESEAELASMYDEGEVEERQQRHRILTRQHGSQEDLSLLPKPRIVKPKSAASTRPLSVSSKTTTVASEEEASISKKKGKPLPIRVKVSDIELPEQLPVSMAADKVYNSVKTWDDVPQFKAFIEALPGGGKCIKISRGSLVFEVECEDEKTADALWSAYRSGKLETVLKEILQKKSGATKLSLDLSIGLEEYNLLKEELAQEGVDELGGMPESPTRPARTSVAELRQKFSKMATIQSPDDKAKPKEMPDSEIFPAEVPLRRAKSAPDLLDEEDWDLTFPGDFNTYMEELEIQRRLIEEAKTGKVKEPFKKAPEDPTRELVSSLSRSVEQLTPIEEPKKVSVASPTPAEKSREGGLKYVILPSQIKKKKKKQIDPKRLEEIDKFLRERPREITRSESLPKITVPLEEQLKVPKYVRHERRSSLPNFLDFDKFGEERNLEEGEDVREWVRDIWDDWFDEVFPPPSEQESISPTTDILSIHAPTPTKKVLSSDSEDKRRASITSSVISEHVDTIDPLPEVQDEFIEDYEDEIIRLSESIEMAGDKPSPFDLCRRGALYRKIGNLKGAWEDLDSAIELEPQLLDAYWHRHLLFLLKNNKRKALDDLNVVLKLNKQHAGAYRSRAEIFRQQGNITMAIVNYTQAIKLLPDDYEAYYARAEMYEKRGEILLALEDYRDATKLMPSKTEAIFKHGLYQFNNQNWMATIKDFSEMLVQEPNNALARTYRGRAYAKQGLYTNAIEDLSIAIHLDPHNSVAFYHRGCLLRRAHPKKALQDFSVSILLDDSQENVLAYLHRGILYMDMERYEDAISDFEEVIKLDRSVACPHLNLGLIYMIRMENYPKAIACFTNAIKVDATYWRAMVCRAEAHHKLHDLKNALLDYTRAIHLKPDLQHLYMHRGKILLEMKNLDLASFCVKHAAELSEGLGISPTQQAAVFSFLQEYSKATEALAASSRVKPTVATFVLLGKTQMKDKKLEDATESLEKALELMEQDRKYASENKYYKLKKPWQEKEPWPREAAEVQFLIGMCQMELCNYLKSFEAFNSAIKIRSDYAEAYYQRGLVRMRLRQSKGVQDFNRALAINPKLFQAYLSRAAFYGMKGRYSKGIINCNEAIKLQPNSVRAYLYRGALKYHIKAYDLAIRDLTKALEIDNTCSLAYFNRAVCYHTMKQYDNALRDYGIVLLLGEDNILKVLINRGLMYFERKDYKNALQDFYQAVTVEPKDPKIRHTLGLCFHKLNRLEEAVQTFTGALLVDRYFLDALIGRGNAFMDYGHEIANTAARHDYETAIHLDPVCLPARVNLGYNLQVSGKFQQAWNHFTACLQISSDYKPALEGRAVVCLQMRNTGAAFKDINAALKVEPSAELYTNRGVVNQFMGDRTNAIKDYQSAIKQDPTYALAYFNAANLYFHTRQFRQAKDYYDKAFEFNPRDESAVLNRAITKVMLRDTKGALEDFKIACKRSPHSAHVYFNRGNLYASLGQFDKAEKDYTQALELKPDDALVHKRRADVLGKLGRQDEAIVDYKRAIEIRSKKHI
ncbi:uncharacterized protein [Ptychodera flava]|uniref:uncharacterized protein isoform X2 n=1 Tax=Ptychodera flava TaxID=63121 RepID=UPI00396A09F4